jgi:hypothetical protein
MSQFKVGDVVEIVDTPDFVNPHCRKYIGHVGALKRDCGNGYWRVAGAVKATNKRPCEHHESTLRLKRPPSDFTPAETEFTDWLRKQVRVVS